MLTPYSKFFPKPLPSVLRIPPQTPERICSREILRQALESMAGKEAKAGNSIICSVGDEAGELRGLFFPLTDAREGA